MKLVSCYNQAGKKIEELLEKVERESRLKEKARKEYETKLASYQETLKGFSHKDQKPYWDSKS